MASVSIYLNFMGKAEEAFTFYKSVFGTEYLMPPMYLGDAPPNPGRPELAVIGFTPVRSAIVKTFPAAPGGTPITATLINTVATY